MSETKKDRMDNEIKKSLIELADLRENEHFEIDISRVFSSKIGSIKIGRFPRDIKLMIFQDTGCFSLGFDREGQVSRCKSLPYHEWHHKFGVVTYGKVMAKVIEETSKNNKNVEFMYTDDDGENFDIWYKLECSKDSTIAEAIASIENFEKELKGHTERILEGGSIDREVLKNEKKFALTVLLPLLRSMDYRDVQFNHGQREFGKDIIFSDMDKLGFRRVFGVQAKAGDISGKAGSELDKLIAQIDDAFEVSYLDIYSKERRHITDLIIAVSGRFTGNAPQKICEKTSRDNVHFLDIDKIQELLWQYMGKEIT